MALLPAAHLPPRSVVGSPLVSSGGWGGRIPSAHADWHATQGLGSVCPLATRSAWYSIQRTCTNPSWAHGMGTSTWLSPDSPAESYRARLR